MTINKKIDGILNGKISIGNSKLRAHFYHNFNKGEKSWFTYYSTSEIPAFSADDTVKDSEINVTVTIFSQSNILSAFEQMKAKMRASGFIWTGDSSDMFDPDTEYFQKSAMFVISKGEI